MDSKDLDRYLMAKRQQRLANYISLVATALAVGAGVLLYLGIEPGASKAILIGSAIGLVLANSEFGLHGAVVSRQSLLEIIESQINRDPEALSYIAKSSSIVRRVG